MKRSIVALVAFLAVTSGFLSPAEAGDDVMVPVSLIVKVDDAAAVEHTALDGLLNEPGIQVDALIASRGVFRISTDFTGKLKSDGKIELKDDAKKWHERVRKHDAVIWLMTENDLAVEDERFHAWPQQSSQQSASVVDLIDQPALQDLNLDLAHETAIGAGVRVAVLDTGVDVDHPLLAGHLSPGYDLIDDDDDPSEESNGVDDDGDGSIDEAYGHGTFVAGIIAQVSPGAQIVPIRLLDDDGRADEYAVLEAIALAIELDVDVITMSFGLVSDKKSKPLEEILKEAKEHDIVIVAAAGNSAQEGKRYPAAHKNVLSVGALDESGEVLASFSNRGKWVQVAAPGVGLVSSVPAGGYAEWGGTSVATPVVAGLASLAIEVAPDESAKKIVEALVKPARPMRDKDVERGIIDIAATFERLD